MERTFWNLVNQNFDYEKYHLCTIQNDIIEHFEKGKGKIEPVKDAEVVKAIRNLKIGKLPDIDGITAEHYNNASTELLPISVHTLNTIVEQLDIPVTEIWNIDPCIEEK